MAWYYQHGEADIVGPVDLETLHRLAAEGKIDGNTQVAFAEGKSPPEEWRLAHSVKGLNLKRASGATDPTLVRAAGAQGTRRLPPDSELRAGGPRIYRVRVAAASFFLMLLGISCLLVGVFCEIMLMLRSLDDFKFYNGNSLETILYRSGSKLVAWGIGLIVISLLLDMARVLRAFYTASRSHFELSKHAHPDSLGDTKHPLA